MFGSGRRRKRKNGLPATRECRPGAGSHNGRDFVRSEVSQMHVIQFLAKMLLRLQHLKPDGRSCEKIESIRDFCSWKRGVVIICYFLASKTLSIFGSADTDHSPQLLFPTSLWTLPRTNRPSPFDSGRWRLLSSPPPSEAHRACPMVMQPAIPRAD
jgi:hypothetical protein